MELLVLMERAKESLGVLIESKGEAYLELFATQ